MIELDEDFLNLLYKRWNHQQQEILQSFTKNHKLVLGRKIQEMKATSLELTKNKMEDFDGVHGVVMVISSISLSFFSNLPSNPFSL